MSEAWRALERRLTAQCDHLRHRQLAWVTRCHPEVQVVRSLKGGRVEGFVCGIRLDFEGLICPSGRSVVLEAKTSHEKTSWPMSDLGDAQAQRMASHASCGGLSVLYVQQLNPLGISVAEYLLPVDGEGRIARLLTHPALAFLQTERKSLRWEDLAPWQVQRHELWLDAAARLGVL
jgi:hypothetical protein